MYSFLPFWIIFVKILVFASGYQKLGLNSKHEIINGMYGALHIK